MQPSPTPLLDAVNRMADLEEKCLGILQSVRGDIRRAEAKRAELVAATAEIDALLVTLRERESETASVIGELRGALPIDLVPFRVTTCQACGE